VIGLTKRIVNRRMPLIRGAGGGGEKLNDLNLDPLGITTDSDAKPGVLASQPGCLSTP